MIKKHPHILFNIYDTVDPRKSAQQIITPIKNIGPNIEL